jgi:cytolysin-activating lysine-acyltransferase
VTRKPRTKKKDAEADTDKAVVKKVGPTGSQAGDVIADHHLLAGAALLLLESPAHRHYFLADFDWLVRPAITLKQCKLFFESGKPAAFASWAFMSDEAEERFAQSYRLAPRDWQSGNHLWLVDLVCPGMKSGDVLKYMRASVFAGRQFKYLVRQNSGISVNIST